MVDLLLLNIWARTRAVKTPCGFARVIVEAVLPQPQLSSGLAIQKAVVALNWNVVKQRGFLKNMACVLQGCIGFGVE